MQAFQPRLARKDPHSLFKSNCTSEWGWESGGTQTCDIQVYPVPPTHRAPRPEPMFGNCRGWDTWIVVFLISWDRRRLHTVAAGSSRLGRASDSSRENICLGKVKGICAHPYKQVS